MKLTLLAEWSGKHNYKDTGHCPIAKALKAAGFTEVQVGSMTYDVTAPDGKEYVNIPLSGTANEIAMDWTKSSQSKDMEIELQDPSSRYLVHS